MKPIRMVLLLAILLITYVANAQIEEGAIIYLDPFWSPDGEYIAFMSNQAGETDIWIIKPDGTGLLNVTASVPGESLLSAWSPDSRQIAFFSNNDNERTVWMVNVDGSHPVKISPDYTVAVMSYPAWSPDGRQIALATVREDVVEYTLWLVSPGDGQAQFLTNGYRPAWSPDGQKIAFFYAQPDGLMDVGIINLDGSGLYLYDINTPSTFSSLAWSPDGQKLAYNARNTPLLQSSGEVWVIDMSTMQGYQLTSGLNAGAFRWSPDGRSMVIRHEEGLQSEIWIIQSDGTGQHEFFQEKPKLFAAHTPEWSPDGLHLMLGGSHYYYPIRDRTTDTWLSSADGTELLNLTEAIDEPAGFPRWSPDGQRVVFTSGNLILLPPSYIDNIWVMDADGSNQLRLIGND